MKYIYIYIYIYIYPMKMRFLSTRILCFMVYQQLVGYLMPKSFLLKNSRGAIFTQSLWGIERGIHSFSGGIHQKVSVIAWMDFELANYVVTVKHVSHSVKRSTRANFEWSLSLRFAFYQLRQITHHKKGLVPYLPVTWGGQQIHQLRQIYT